MKYFFSFVAALCLIILSACSQGTSLEKTSPTLKVSASFYPLAFLAEYIGGPHVQVSSIIPAGAEPHEYEPSPSQIKQVYDSQVFLYHGTIDPWGKKLEKDLQSKGVNVLEVATPFMNIAGQEERESLDPHIWNDPILVQEMGKKITEILTQTDPKNADYYAMQLQKLTTEIQEIDNEFTKKLQNCAVRSLIVNHNAFSYLGKRYGIEILAINGLSPESEPSPARLAELARLAKEKNIHAVLFETLASSKMAETLAKEIGVKTMVLNPLEGITPAEIALKENFLSIMKNNIQTIATALECK